VGGEVVVFVCVLIISSKCSTVTDNKAVAVKVEADKVAITPLMPTAISKTALCLSCLINKCDLYWQLKITK